MAFDSRLPVADGTQGGIETTRSSLGEVPATRVPCSTKPPKQRRAVQAETIEARLARKAAVADTKTFATISLGEMTREQRHKLLYGD